ncbi:MAG: ribosome maturation factor RimP [Vicinamibacterales bacterium]
MQRVRAIAERVARSRGLEVFDVHLRREAIGPVLRVVIDRPAPAASRDGTSGAQGATGPVGPEEPIGIEDCQRVSQEVGAILDVEDPIDGAYVLEVSSPGLDRPLRHAGDYDRFRGRLAKLVLAETVDGQRHFKGRIRGLEAESVVIEEEHGRRHMVPLSAIKRARLEVEF